MKFTDEQLMAFADGQLESGERAAIEAARAADPQIAARIDAFRAQRERLRRAFDGVLAEPVPERLLTAARTAPADERNVVGIGEARAARREKAPRSFALPQWAAMAASLVLGLIVGSVFLTADEGELLATRDGGLVATGELAAALTERASGEAAPVSIPFSYRAQSGEYCRTFTVTRDAALAGIACREDEEWSVRVLSDLATVSGGDYRMAGAELPSVVLLTVETQIDGEPLDADEERAARDASWRE